MKKSSFLLLCLCSIAGVHGQPKASDYVPPVDIPMLLAGNVGEIRPNHFHSGIDIKTQGVIGKNVLSAADGYVSRISVSPAGYGKALYINHPNGTTTVYGHLEAFNDTITGYVRNEQYRRKSFAVDLYLKPGQIRVRQGEFIAYSGNSGSSGGPHLHFEIRDQITQDPLNVMARGLITGIADDIAPQFFNLWVIGVDTVKGVPVHQVRSKHTVVKSGGEYRVEGNKRIPFSSPGYFAVEVIDTKSGVSNVVGLSTLQQTIDGVQNFGLSTDRFSFATTRYINTMVDFALHRKARFEVYRTYVSPNNKLPVYEGVRDRGIVTLADEEPHEIELRIEDEAHNVSRLKFTIAEQAPPANRPLPADGIPVWWAKEYIHFQNGLSIRIPAEALYESILLRTEVLTDSLPGAFSPVYRIMNTDVPLQKAITISIRPDSLPERLRSKACLASLSANKRRIYEGGAWEKNRVTGTSRTFGDYFVTVDTVPPRFTPNFTKGADLSNQRAFSLTMRDDFSGIGAWSVEIDGQWALFDYDAKSNTIRHWFRDARYEKGGRHTLKAVATDNKGNRTEITTEFIW